MDLKHTWSAVCRPGRAARYFAAHAERPFAPSLTDYHPLTAWWMAELSRLVYRRDPDGSPGRGRRPRADFLTPVGLREHQFIARGGAECAVIAPLDAAAPDFRAVVFRGSEGLQDWVDFVLDFGPVDWPGGGRVHGGFVEALDEVWPEIEQAIPAGAPFLYAGHSLGGAMATLAAARHPPTAAYTFGAPPVGNRPFTRALDHVRLFRVVNVDDAATNGGPLSFIHAGEFRYIRHDGVMLTNPDERTVTADRLARGPFHRDRPVRTRLVGPPQDLADHAPINYVVRLQRLVDASVGTAATIGHSPTVGVTC